MLENRMEIIKQLYIIILFIFLCSCSRVIIYNDSAPAYKGQVISCPKIHAKISFIMYNRIRDGKDYVDYPMGLELENKVLLRGQPNLALELKMVNPFRERLSIYFCTNHSRKLIYNGNLPYRKYTVRLSVEGGENKEAWIEFRKKDKLICMTGRAMYKILKNKIY